jgi:hypothetical protein
MSQNTQKIYKAIQEEPEKLHDFIGQVSLRKKSPINKGPMWKV